MEEATGESTKEKHLGTYSFEKGNFQNLGKGSFDPSQVCIMPIVHLIDGQPRPLGTCFVIANSGLAITARHVIDEAFGAYFDQGTPNLDIPESHALWAIYSSNEANVETGHFVGGPLPVLKMWTNSGMDIALLQLSVPTNTETGEKLYLPALQLSPAAPLVDTEIVGFGYRRMRWRQHRSGYNAAQRYTATKGHIQQIYFPRRDSVFMSFPCFETSARFDGGMSGGPIISSQGQVCGVICSSMKTDASDGTFTSYGSLIAPALAIVLDGRDSTGTERKLFLHDFVRDGAVSADHTLSQIKVHNAGKEIVVDLGGGMTFKNAIKDG